MHITVDTSELQAAAVKLHGTAEAVRDGWARLAFDIGQQAEGFIKKEFRSGPTSSTTTQIRSNRLRQAYSSRVRREAFHIDLDVGLVKPGLSAEVLGYGAMMEGINADGSRFTEKKIRAKAGGYLTFPIYDPNTPGTAQGNIKGWVRKREVTFRPRPSLDAAILKFEPIMRDEATKVLEQVAGGVA
jgi:hypothetical protein